MPLHPRRGSSSRLVNRRPAKVPAIEGLESRQFLSATYFVSPNGNDANNGSLATPFKTIQRAADVATAGSHVEIETGTYHETVTAKHSGTSGAPIVFEAYNGEKVTISGANQVTGWTSYGNSIYTANVSTNLGEGNNAVFVDGKGLNEARFPNSGLDPSHPATATISSVKVGHNSMTIYNSGLSQPAGFWTGALIHFNPGQAWVDQTGTVTSSAPGSITVSFQSPDASNVKWATPQAGNKFYIVGKLGALDTGGEWYMNGGKLYLRTPGSDNPANHDVEVKARQVAFDFSGQHDITLQGVNIFAATIHTSSSSSNVVINHITASYISSFFAIPNGWIPQAGGITLKAFGDILENSNIGYSAGDGVIVGAAGVSVLNNTIHDVDTVGGDMAGIRVGASSVTISGNTIYNAGRDGIKLNGTHIQCLHNTIHDIGLQTTEPGGIYTVQSNGAGSVIAYNNVYNIHTAGYGGTGIFLDNNSNNWTVHDNTTNNVDYGMKLNFTCQNDILYNNHLGATIFSINTNQQGNWNGTQIHNNVFMKKIVVTPGAKIYSNTFG